MDNELVKLQIVGITYNQIENGMYALVLEEENGKLRLPIIIGYSEAQSIECILQKITTPRPLTHEFTKEILESFSIKIESVVLRQLSTGVFAGEVKMTKGEEIHVLDARSSDAIAMAMRTGASIFTTRELLDKCGVEKNAFSPASNHIISNRSIPVRQAVERVKNPSGDSIDKVSLDQLEDMMQKAVDEEDYEKAGEIKKEMDRRLNNNSDSNE